VAAGVIAGTLVIRKCPGGQATAMNQLTAYQKPRGSRGRWKVQCTGPQLQVLHWLQYSVGELKDGYTATVLGDAGNASSPALAEKMLIANPKSIAAANEWLEAYNKSLQRDTLTLNVPEDDNSGLIVRGVKRVFKTGAFGSAVKRFVEIADSLESDMTKLSSELMTPAQTAANQGELRSLFSKGFYNNKANNNLSYVLVEFEGYLNQLGIKYAKFSDGGRANILTSKFSFNELAWFLAMLAVSVRLGGKTAISLEMPSLRDEVQAFDDNNKSTKEFKGALEDLQGNAFLNLVGKIGNKSLQKKVDIRRNNIIVEFRDSRAAPKKAYYAMIPDAKAASAELSVQVVVEENNSFTVSGVFSRVPSDAEFERDMDEVVSSEDEESGGKGSAAAEDEADEEEAEEYSSEDGSDSGESWSPAADAKSAGVQSAVNTPGVQNSFDALPSEDEDEEKAAVDAGSNKPDAPVSEEQAGPEDPVGPSNGGKARVSAEVKKEVDTLISSYQAKPEYTDFYLELEKLTEFKDALMYPETNVPTPEIAKKFLEQLGVGVPASDDDLSEKLEEALVDHLPREYEKFKGSQTKFRGKIAESKNQSTSGLIGGDRSYADQEFKGLMELVRSRIKDIADFEKITNVRIAFLKKREAKFSDEEKEKLRTAEAELKIKTDEIVKLTDDLAAAQTAVQTAAALGDEKKALEEKVGILKKFFDTIGAKGTTDKKTADDATRQFNKLKDQLSKAKNKAEGASAVTKQNKLLKTKSDKGDNFLETIRTKSFSGAKKKFDRLAIKAADVPALKAEKKRLEDGEKKLSNFLKTAKVSNLKELKSNFNGLEEELKGIKKVAEKFPALKETKKELDKNVRRLEGKLKKEIDAKKKADLKCSIKIAEIVRLKAEANESAKSNKELTKAVTKLTNELVDLKAQLETNGRERKGFIMIITPNAEGKDLILLLFRGGDTGILSAMDIAARSKFESFELKGGGRSYVRKDEEEKTISLWDKSSGADVLTYSTGGTQPGTLTVNNEGALRSMESTYDSLLRYAPYAVAATVTAAALGSTSLQRIMMLKTVEGLATFPAMLEHAVANGFWAWELGEQVNYATAMLGGSGVLGGVGGWAASFYLPRPGQDGGIAAEFKARYITPLAGSQGQQAGRGRGRGRRS
jgi:hypothetical protein